jgi:hypothetical protein
MRLSSADYLRKLVTFLSGTWGQQNHSVMDTSIGCDSQLCCGHAWQCTGLNGVLVIHNHDDVGFMLLQTRQAAEITTRAFTIWCPAIHDTSVADTSGVRVAATCTQNNHDLSQTSASRRTTGSWQLYFKRHVKVSRDVELCINMMMMMDVELCISCNCKLCIMIMQQMPIIATQSG